MKRPDVISLDQVTDEPVSFDFELEMPVGSLDREPLVEISPVRFSGQVAPVERGYSLEGQVSYRGRLECSRCLTAYPFQEEDSFSLTLCKLAPPGGGDVGLETSDLDVLFYEDPSLSVAPIVEERIQLAVPMKPLCQPECRGLCSQCGADWNKGHCHCAPKTADPRWEALSALGASGGSTDHSSNAHKKV